MKTLELAADAIYSMAVDAAMSGLPGLRTPAARPLKPGDGGTDRVAEEESGVDDPVEVSTAMVKTTATVYAGSA